MEYYGRTRNVYSLSSAPFKQGGEGAVYNIDGYPDYVAKIYHANVVTGELAAKIKYMTNNPPSQLILNQIAWPIDYLTDARGMFVGFIMPKLKIDAELGELYIYPPQKIKLTNEQKLIVAINICKVIAEIHKAGFVFGDFNPCNIGVNLTTGHVAFLDTDSYHIYDTVTKKTYRCVVCLNGYVAPELITKCKGNDYRSVPLPTFTKETDRFSLAIHIFRLLFNGFTPYNGIIETENASQASPGIGNLAIERDHYCFKPGFKPLSVAVPPLNSFPQEIQDLFTRAFIVGRYNAELRPSAEEWDRALDNYRRSLVQCTKNPMHYFDRRLQFCPYCEADRLYKEMLLGSLMNSNSSNPVVMPPPPSTGSQLSFAQPAAVHKHKQKPKKKKKSRKKFTLPKINFAAISKKKLAIILAVILSAIALIAGGIVGIVFYNKGANKAKRTYELIQSLPESITGDVAYEKYGKDIDAAYASYHNLNGWQKKKVDNRDKLLSIVDGGYTDYKITKLKAATAKVDPATIASDPTAIKTVYEIYSSLYDEQKTSLTTSERELMANYTASYAIVDRIEVVGGDLLNKYNTVHSTIFTPYENLNAEYKSYVYNYDKTHSFYTSYCFLKRINYTATDIGYSIKVKPGSTFKKAEDESGDLFGGTVTIPDKVNGKPIVAIADGGFKNRTELTTVIIPDTVKIIGNGAFQGCSGLENITLPFVGKSEASRSYESVFGYIFGFTWCQGNSSGTDSENFVSTHVYIGNLEGTTCQYSCYKGEEAGFGRKRLKSYHYYIPQTIKNVTVTNQTTIPTAAFYNCSFLDSVKYTSGTPSEGSFAFTGCKEELAKIW